MPHNAGNFRRLVQPLGERLKLIGLARGLIPADAVDPRKTERHAGFMPRRAMHRVERHLEHQRLLHLAHRPEPRYDTKDTTGLIVMHLLLIGTDCKREMYGALRCVYANSI